MSERDGIEQDPYAVLGISESATAEDIKRAYRDLAKRWHPDSNPDDPRAAATFARVSLAYETLSAGSAPAAHGDSPVGMPSEDSAVGWYKDPYHAHEFRWFSGGNPTHLVRDGGVTSSDDPPAEPFTGPLVAPDDVPVRNETMRAGRPPEPTNDPPLLWYGSSM